MIDVPMSIRLYQAMHEKQNSECSAAMGVDGSYFTRIKSGKVSPNIKHLTALVKGVMPVSEFIKLGER